MRRKISQAAKRRVQQQRVGLRRLNQLHERLIRLPNTFATYVGQPCRKGEWRSETAIVCLVSQKKSPSHLLPGRAIPKTLRWGRKKRAAQYGTDVLRAQPRFTPAAAVLGPGDDVVSGAAHATVGVALMHPTLGACVTTAAHLFESAGRGTQVKISRGGTLQSVRATVRPITSLVDYALLSAPVGTQCENLFDDSQSIGPVFSPTEVDVGSPVFVLLSSGKLQQTICRGIHAAINTPEETLRDCILTDFVTLSGDSGACLVDRKMRVWALLRGRLDRTFSVFAPIQHILDGERATLL